MKNKVFVQRCQAYEDSVYAMQNLIDSLGGIDKFCKKGDVVAIKVNLVCGASPDKMCTTHPLLVKALAQIICESGATCVIVDSPGGPFNSIHLKSVYSKTGMKDVSQSVNGVSLNDNFNYITKENEKNVYCKSFSYLEALENADVIINFAKCKTHTYMGYTGAIKNLFGVIPGLIKVEMHGNYVSQIDFANMLIDINESIKDKIVLNILDAVIGMQGQGPTGGEKIDIGYIMASENAYMLDLAQVKLMSKDIEQFPLIKVMRDRGFIDKNYNCDIVHCNSQTESDNQLSVIKNYDIPKCEVYNALKKGIPPKLQPLFHKLMTRRPVIKRKKCKGCAKCFEHCPVKAIEMKKDKNRSYACINYAKCIRCYCCQELCPFHVVKIKSGILYKILRFREKGKKHT